MLAISLALALAPDRGPMPFASIPIADWDLGRRVFVVQLDSLPDETDDEQFFDCVSTDKTYRTIEFQKGVDVRKRKTVIVMATPILIRHCEELEFRLADANLIENITQINVP